jgi:hypothetical protein
VAFDLVEEAVTGSRHLPEAYENGGKLVGVVTTRSASS